MPGALALVALAGALTWTLQQRGRERWAREEALPRLEALIGEDDYQGAFDLATRIGQVIPNDPRLKALEPVVHGADQSRPANRRERWSTFARTTAPTRTGGRSARRP